ncbi:hypothetical protein BC832DRAFT_287763 [Gaertneriomyces semiglobifer]|nr:hypothetical protein BC832DRAFT_287763 [Gaertneriomyces semiglobifer]
MPPRTLQKGTSFIDLTPFAFTRVQFERNQTQGLIPQEFLATVERQRANPSDPLDVRISGVAVADVDGVVVLPHVPRTVTLPAMNTGNLAPDMLVKRCRHQLGPGTAAINKSGFVLDWNGGADRLAVEEGLVRIQTESMAVMRLLQAILREPPVSGD